MSRGRGFSRAGLLGSAASGTARVSVVAVLITVGFTTALFLLAGANPIDAYIRYLVTPLTSQFGLLEVAVAATPILLTGAAVAIAFRAGFWNIGAEGQLLAGAVAAAAIGPLVGDLPSWVAIPLMIAGGALAGAAWVLVPALMRVRLGIDEVVTTLLLNPVALLMVNALLHGPWRDAKTGFPESPRIADSAIYPDLIEKSRLHLGFLVALIILLVAWYVMTRTGAGLRMRAVGLSPHAARFAGMNVERTLLSVALVSGAIAGIAGVGEVAGIQHKLTSGLSSGFGYTGIVVAMLGGLTMPGVLIAGLLLGDLAVGASSASRPLHIPSQMGQVLQGVLLLVTVGLLAVRQQRVARSDRPPDESEPAPDEPPESVPGRAPVEASPV
jgi:general nucleoside transport system permease protein